MPDSSLQTQSPLHWKPAALIGRVAPKPKIRDWLATADSLTQRIREHCPKMQVNVLSETWEKPLRSESAALAMTPGQRAWIRCVLLQCADQNWVYARTVIPNMIAGNPWRSLQRLGNQPLGEVLFQLKNLQRSDFEFSHQSFKAWPGLYEAIKPSPLTSQNTWSRRSRFTQKGAPLLLTEVFLPDLTDS